MSYVFHAHSGLRYAVLLAAAVALVVFALGLSRAQPFSRLHRVVGAAYAGLVHLQVGLGLVLVAMGKYDPRVLGHMALMLLAAVVLQALLSVNRRRATPGLRLPVVAVVLSVLCFLGGLAAIGRGVFETTAFVAPLG